MDKNTVYTSLPVFQNSCEQFFHLPSVVPSSPMMIFIEVIICWATGGDIEVAYMAL